MSITTARFSLLARSAVVAACGLFLFSASHARASARLHNFSLNECAKTFCISASGENAYLSLISPTFAAPKTELFISVKDHPAQLFQCGALAYVLSASLLTCELPQSRKTLVVDLSASTFRLY